MLRPLLSSACEMEIGPLVQPRLDRNRKIDCGYNSELD